jgi:hypothetical protein
MSLSIFISSLKTAADTAPVETPFTAGPDQSVNSGDTVQLAGSEAGTWTTSGSGTFDDNTLANAVYTPSEHDIVLGVITLTLTTSEASDSVQLTFVVTEAYVLTLVSRYWDAEDATDSGGNLTAWVDRKAAAAMTNVGTPTVTTNALSGKKAVSIDGTSSALATPRVNYKSLKVTYGASGDNKRLTYWMTAAEMDTDPGDNLFYNYSFRNLIDFRRNMLQQFSDTETTTTDTTSTATNMFFGCRRLGNNTGTADQFAKVDWCAIFLTTTEWTVDQSIIIDRYINARWPAIHTVTGQQYLPIAASVSERSTTSLGNGHTNGGGAGNFYPAGVVLVGSNLHVMAKAPNNTGCMRTATTSNYKTMPWSEVASGKITSQAVAGFNETYAYRAGTMYFDGSLYHNWFTARNGSAIESIGHVSNASVTAARGNGVRKLTAAMINAALGTSYTSCSTASVRRVNGQWYMVCGAYDGTKNDIILCSMSDATGTSITPLKVLISANMPYNWAGCCCIVEYNGKFIAFFHKGLLETSRGQRAVYMAISDTFDGTYKEFLYPILEARWTTTGAFDEGGAYDPEMLVENDGNYLTPQLVNGEWLLFFAGYTLPVEIGQIGHCAIDPTQLYEIATF